MIDIELGNVIIGTVDKVAIDVVPSAVEPCNVPSNTNVEYTKKEYSIVGDRLYAQVTAEEAPQWLLNIIDSVLASMLAKGLSDLTEARNSIIQAISEIEVAKNQYQELINIEATIDRVIASRLQTLNATIASNSASIINLDITKVTADQALAISANHLSAELLGGSVKSAITNLQTVLTTPILANANSIDTLLSTINDPSTGLFAMASATESLQTYVGIDAAGVSSGTGLSAYFEGSDGKIGTAGSELLNNIKASADGVESKFAYNSNLNINGIHYSSGFGLNSRLIDPGSGIPEGTSEFWINADKFRFTNNNKTGRAAPFTIDASGTTPQVTFNGIVKFSNVSDVPTIPTATSQLTNNSGYTTLATVANQGYVLPAGVAYAINTNTTTINGSKITTGTLAASRLYADSITGITIRGSSIEATSSAGTTTFSGAGRTTSIKGSGSEMGVYGYGTFVGIGGRTNSTDSGAAGVYGVGRNGVIGEGTTTGVAASGGTWDFYAAGTGIIRGSTVSSFTGQHDALAESDSVYAIGDIIVDTHLVYADSVNDSVFSTRLSLGVGDKPFGVCASNFSTNPPWCMVTKGRTENVTPGEEAVLEEVLKPNASMEGYKAFMVNSLGEGQINVCGEGGEFKNGDLITTSSIPGKGMRQNKEDGTPDDIIRNITVAKVRGDWSFESPNEIKLIPCIYLCG